MRHLFLFFFFTLTLQAQFRINGIVKESASNKALAFASITTNNGINSISDVDGKFEIISSKPITFFYVSYIGYNKTKIDILNNNRFFNIKLVQNTAKLNEVVVATQNAANTIIKKTIALKDTNNPEKKLANFAFKTYNKLIVSANPDSISGKIDSIIVKKTKEGIYFKIDSANYKFKNTVNKRHLFQTEKVSQFQFSNNKLKETILGAKMAGLKQPLYEIIAFNLQSFSIYDSKYELFETKYNSPIAQDALKDYNYKLLDTVAVNGRNAYMIYFKNKKKSKAKGLEGILYIDQNNFAVAKAIMRIRGLLDISGTHEFEYLANENLWFPTHKNFRIIKGQNDDDINFLGGTIQFDGDMENDFSSRKKQPSDYIFLRSESHIFDFEKNTNNTLKNPSFAVAIEKNAFNKEESFWDTYRKDNFDIRNQKTYSALDSIAVRKKIAHRVQLGKKVINGYLPIGFFDMDLRKLFSYNNYEGFRLGLGGITNERLSKYFRMEGYYAYGTKDGIFKGSIGAAAKIDSEANSWLGISYTDDVREIASTSFTIEKKPFKIYDPRPINISTFYNYVSWKSYFETKKIPKTESIWELNHSEIQPKFDYTFSNNNKLYTNYTMTTAMVSLQWSPFSDFMQTPTGQIEIEKRFPKFTFQYTQSLGRLWNNDFDFSKFDFKTEYEKKYLNGQKTSLLFQAGYALGDIPLTHLYNTSPNNITKETIIQRITFGGKNSFETMFFNEFFSNKYALFQFKHAFNRVTLFKKVKPSLVLVSRMAWGNLNHPEQHLGLNFKTLDRGFFESGIELNQIFNGLGLTAFYRYGPNQLPKFEDNIAIKLSYVLNLGF
ncbi:CarboxypepD_reg-like domain-containing protein [Flavobacterium glycines]|uniref:CarboxypepD_reg-like domain-containing protein n=1 Tax=Flavobacterium glycines TaxID=551990 RepID=A0A1B9DSG5_9FLAO|nr:DUF5686 family protein [Flavobacterium glycines]OCB72608.1 hypothetical protein FBGL_08195 [Flavobacterium glycines]SDI81234.1 CarboxypepD_reg-like domain-containing protein [Flavobacterium glycines]